MKQTSAHFLFVPIIVFSTLITMNASEDNRKPFRGSAPYNAIHTAATVLSYPCGLLLAVSTPALCAFALGFDGMPSWLKNMKSSTVQGAIIGSVWALGPLAGAALICGTPVITNKFLCKKGYLTKEEAIYSQKEMFIQSSARLAALVFLWKYGNTSTNALKQALYTARKA